MVPTTVIKMLYFVYYSSKSWGAMFGYIVIKCRDNVLNQDQFYDESSEWRTLIQNLDYKIIYWSWAEQVKISYSKSIFKREITFEVLK